MCELESVLNGQVAVVTGAGRGIGRAVARKLAHLGAFVYVNYSRSEADAKSLCDEIAAAGGSAQPICFNVGNAEEVDAAFEKMLKERGRLDILVNNAGVTSDGLMIRLKNADWQRTLDINLSGAFYCARACVKSMMKARAGRIVNISSVVGEMGNAGQTAYAASKAGLIGLTKAMAREFASRGITVNAVAPGFVVTDMTGALSEEQRAELAKGIPLGRFGTVEDIAEAVAFLSMPSAGYITGEVLGVNGGMYM